MNIPNDEVPTDAELVYVPLLTTGTKVERAATLIALRILHLLTHFPKLSHSMIQIGMGSATPARDWRPILDEMIIEGYVQAKSVQVITPNGRAQQYLIISLAD